MTPAPDPPPWVTVVSGLPRSGTSLMMQLVRALGLPVWADGRRPPDENNPAGYFEHSEVIDLLTGPEAMARSLGQAVKIVYPLVLRLPKGVDHHYRVLFMRRDLGEVVASQRAMAVRLGRPTAAVADDRLAHYWSEQLRDGLAALRGRVDCRVLEVSFASAVADPRAVGGEVARFLGLPEPDEGVAAVSRPELYRSRRPVD